MKATFDLSLRRAIMSMKELRKSAIFFIGAIMTVFSLPARLSAQVLHLQSGTTTVGSSQASCDQAVLPTPDPGGTMDTGCSDGKLTMVLSTALGTTPLPRKVSGSAYSRLIIQFQVDTQPGAPDVSVLPVVITLPVTWKGSLEDGDLVPLTGPSSGLGSFADVNGQLYLATGQAGNLQAVGPTIATNNFMAATHTGVAGCLSVPKTAVSAALMVGECAAGVLKKEQGNGTIYLSGMIQTGQTYDVVLELEGSVFAASSGGVLGGSPTGDGLVDFRDDFFGKIDPSRGLIWTDP